MPPSSVTRSLTSRSARPSVQRGQGDDDELTPVRQLVGDRLARLDAQLQQQRGHLVGLGVELRPGPGAARPGRPGVGDRGRVRALAGPLADPLADRHRGRLGRGQRSPGRRSPGRRSPGRRSPGRPGAGGAGATARAGGLDRHVQPDRAHLEQEPRVGVGVGQPALAVGPGGGHGQGHEHPVVVEGGQVRARQAARAVHGEPVRVLFQVPAHPVELEHRRNPVGFLEPDVGHVVQHAGAVGERGQHGQHGQHVGNARAVHLHRGQPDPVVPYPYWPAWALARHRQAHGADGVDQVGLGMVGLGRRQRGQPAERDVGGVQRGDGQPERGRADVRRQRDRGRPGLLAGLDLEPAPVVADLDAQAELGHHPDGQVDVGALVEVTLDRDHAAAGGERGEQAAARRSTATACPRSRRGRRWAVSAGPKWAGSRPARTARHRAR